MIIYDPTKHSVSQEIEDTLIGALKIVQEIHPHLASSELEEDQAKVRQENLNFVEEHCPDLYQELCTSWPNLYTPDIDTEWFD